MSNGLLTVSPLIGSTFNPDITRLKVIRFHWFSSEAITEAQPQREFHTMHGKPPCIFESMCNGRTSMLQGLQNTKKSTH